MTTTDDRPAVTADQIRHPIWCQHVPDSAPRAGDPLGCSTYYDRLAAPEPSGMHEGREYRLDAGETFAFAVTVDVVQRHETVGGVLHLGPMEVRLAITNHDNDGESAAAYLSPAQVETLVGMLRRANSDLALGR